MRQTTQAACPRVDPGKSAATDNKSREQLQFLLPRGSIDRSDFETA